MLELYENIKKLRLEHGMTQSELAAKAGYADKSMIAKIEKGQVDLTVSKIEVFASVFRVSPGTLVGWSSSNENGSLGIDPAMLEKYERLNSLGKSKADEYVDDLLDNVKYTKDIELLNA